jgi:hypothetical protein
MESNLERDKSSLWIVAPTEEDDDLFLCSIGDRGRSIKY